MSNFSNNKKVKALAVAVSDAMPYVKKSVSEFSQDEVKGKKCGMTMTTYITDTGKVYDGLTVNPEGITEVEYTTTLKNKSIPVEYDSWDTLVNIEDFDKEVIKKRAIHLAKAVQDEVIKDTIYRSCQAVVTTGNADFETLSEGAAKLREVAVAGDAVSFLSPTQMGKIAAGGLAKFIPDDIQKKIYSKNYLGEYAGASQVECQGLPKITTPSAMNFSVSLTDVSGIGFAPVTAGSITGGVHNASIPFRAEGLKVVDVNGMETDQDYIVFADENGKIPELRITVEGQGYGNPNAWVESGTSTLTFEPLLASGTKYEVGSVRIADALKYDVYKFNHVPSTEEIGTESVDGVRIEAIAGGNILDRTSVARLDCPFMAGLPEPRQNVTYFIKK
jgi:hypothetical protein